MLNVPGNTFVRDLSSRRPPARAEGRERLPPFERAEAWAARQPKGRWRTFRLGDGEKAPRLVRALQQRPQTKDEDGRVGPRERLVVIRSCEKTPRTWYTLSNAGKAAPLAEVVRAHGERPAVETCQADCTSSRRWVGARRIGYHRRDGVARAGRVVPTTPGRPQRRNRMSDPTRRPTPPRA